MADGLLFHLESPASDIAVITINDPQKGANILSRPALAELDGILSTLEKRTDLAGLIFRSTKPGNFIAGADLREFAADIDAPAEQIIEISRRGQQLFGRLAKAPFVTVAAIEGICVGGGAELSVWCDRRIMVANSETSFGFPEVKLGIYPGWGGTARTPRIVGLSNAVELITGGESIDAATAQAMGLVDDVTTEGGDSLLAAAIRLVRSEQQTKEYLEDRCRWYAPIAISDTELGFLAATANAYIQGQTKGQYPAPIAALEALIGSAGVDVEAACELEAEGFAPLFGSTVNRALLNVFFLRDQNKKAMPAKGSPREVKSVSVIGAGTMGQGIAAANVKRGIPVALGDTTHEAVARGVKGVLAEASYNKQLKGPDAAKAIELSPLVNGTMHDSELADVDLIIEAIYESEGAKQELYERLEPIIKAHSILATNTSTIPISDLAGPLVRPEQFCGLHFFNPVRMMPLVEVIRGRGTSDDTIATAVAYSRRIGKSPIVVNDGPGFLVNRVLLPYMNEALLLLQEGAPIKAIERAATAFGMPMGPLALYDTVGLDVALHAGGVMASAFPHRVVRSEILPAMVNAGRVGKKGPGGFFNYSGKRNDHGSDSPQAEAIIAPHRKDERKFSTGELIDRLILPMFLEATRVVEDGIAANVRDVDLALIYGIGFPPFHGGLFFWADTIGAEALVKKLEPYETLGDRYLPTELLLRTAKSGKKFYDA